MFEWVWWWWRRHTTTTNNSHQPLTIRSDCVRWNKSRFDGDRCTSLFDQCERANERARSHTSNVKVPFMLLSLLVRATFATSITTHFASFSQRKMFQKIVLPLRFASNVSLHALLFTILIAFVFFSFFIYIQFGIHIYPSIVSRCVTHKSATIS